MARGRGGQDEEIRAIITTAIDTVEITKLIDTLEHLCLDNHFEAEINDKVQFLNGTKFDSDDLHQVALRFRLLRQRGFYVPPDVFNKFKDEFGNFKTTLIGDTKGLLSLYNAAHLLLPNETVLEDAIKFAGDNLKKAVHDLKSPLAEQVSHALKSPLPRFMQKLEARFYIDEYGDEEDSNDTILKFAKLDFIAVLREHCKELKALSLWWKDLRITETLPYARDRIVECYFWILGVYFEPCYSRARIITTKYIILLSVLDDTYDIYATLDECRLLTIAFKRWDKDAVDMLPEYIKSFYLKFINSCNEIESELEPSEKFRVSHFKSQTEIMVDAYLQEASWYAQDMFPEVDIRKELSVVKSSGYPELSCASFIGMGEVATKEAFDWVTSIPKIVRASAEICRFTDDIYSIEREHRVGQCASTFDCYMKQYNATSEETKERFLSWIEDAWRTINEECIVETVPRPLIERVANWAKIMHVIYTHCDNGYNMCENLKDYIAVLLEEPLPF